MCVVVYYVKVRQCRYILYYGCVLYNVSVSICVCVEGIISAQNLRHILRAATPTVDEIVMVMNKFEVMFKLDEERYLIPSLLSVDEATPFIIMPQSGPHVTAARSLTELRLAPPAPISSLPDILIRYLLLPFTPNGFFPRLVARVLNSDLATQVYTHTTTAEYIHTSLNRTLFPPKVPLLHAFQHLK